MAYPTYNGSNPNPTTQDIDVLCQSVRDNVQVVHDSVVSGAMPGWDMTPRNSADTGPPTNPEQPPLIKYVNGAQALHKTITWGTSGGADGNPTQIAYKYSTDSGATFTTISTQSITYDANGNVTGTSWS